MSEAPASIQLTVDHVPFSKAVDEAEQVLSVGFVARITRLGVRHCAVCGKRRVCYAIEVSAYASSGAPAQLVGGLKCAQHAGIR